MLGVGSDIESAAEPKHSRRTYTNGFARFSMFGRSRSPFVSTSGKPEGLLFDEREQSRESSFARREFDAGAFSRAKVAISWVVVALTSPAATCTASASVCRSARTVG